MGLQWREVFRGTAEQFNYSAEGLWPKTKYWFQLGAINARGGGRLSGARAFTTTNEMGPYKPGSACWARVATCSRGLPWVGQRALLFSAGTGRLTAFLCRPPPSPQPTVSSQ